MSDRILSTTLSEARRHRGWSQRELAVRSGVSRAEVSAVEMCRQSPSIATALRLAGALGRTVEELFSLSPTGQSEPSWAWAPECQEGRFWEARVGSRRLLFPVEPTALGSLPHDGSFGPGGVIRRPWAEAQRTLVVAGCDPAVGLLAAELARRDGIRLLALTRGSRDALELLKRGLVHAAGLHWSEESGEDANAAMASSVLGGAGKGFRLVHVARWQEGVALESTVRARSASSIARARLRWIAREEGSGARHVLDRLLGARPRRFRHEARDHRAVALAIRSGYAQAGIAVRLAAEEAGLDFVLVQQEDYELCYRNELRGDEPIAALRKALKRAELRRLTRDLPGLEVARMGEERSVA
ncbi:MAG TPA: substrate-binding domain-containing protein [Vicinamibacteria bacterium]|nr:substrate-binding domain-containing protein [Vicinamibacteria bacterium]